jgi:tetraacyldisaccharide 4'-kinase
VNPLSALYGASVGLRNELYDRGTLSARRLQAPVVSVGSISAGGAGKTPFLIMLGQLLQERGIAFNVLSRGYGRKTKGVRLVDPAGTAEGFGDEPLLIARNLGVPVIVGEDRYAAGQLAEEKFGLQAHLLDDGFQHRRLARDFDIALITQRDLHDTLLPAGRLRERLSSLARASALVLMDDTPAEGIPVGPGQQVWRVTRSIVPPETKEACFAFCGIARPERFFTALGVAGVKVTGTRSLRDHHAYTAQDVEALYRQGHQSGATAFVTTGKDEVNLGPHAERLRPLHVVPLHLEFEAGGESALAQICAVIQGRIKSA